MKKNLQISIRTKILLTVLFILAAVFFCVQKEWVGEKRLISEIPVVSQKGETGILFLEEKKSEIMDETSLETEKIIEAENSERKESPILSPDPSEEDRTEVLPLDFAGYGRQAVLLDISFTSQAPLAEWSDRRQQDGCEEASVLMVMHWINKKPLTLQAAREEIIKISEYEAEKYGSYSDTSAEDTVLRIIRDYFNYPYAEAREISGLEEIKKEILNGHPVIVPTDGRQLKNPYYTPPGPERHNLLIIGYRPATKEFIVNDSGTKRGAKYVYPEKAVENALRDYPTGDHLPIIEIKKMMIVFQIE